MIAIQNVTPRIRRLAAGLFLLAIGALLVLPVRGQQPGSADKSTPSSTVAEVPAAQPDAVPRANLASVPVVEKATLNYHQAAQVTVDARKHCLYIGQPPASGQGALRVDLDRGKTYTVTASGSAFMSDETGAHADPFPGVVFFYGTNAEDGYAIRYVVLKPGDSLTFTTPRVISRTDEVFSAAFFLDAWPDSENRGSYTLTFERAENALSGKIPPQVEAAPQKTTPEDRNNQPSEDIAP